MAQIGRRFTILHHTKSVWFSLLILYLLLWHFHCISPCSSWARKPDEMCQHCESCQLANTELLLSSGLFRLEVNVNVRQSWVCASKSTGHPQTGDTLSQTWQQQTGPHVNKRADVLSVACIIQCAHCAQRPPAAERVLEKNVTLVVFISLTMFVNDHLSVTETGQWRDGDITMTVSTWNIVDERDETKM